MKQICTKMLMLTVALSSNNRLSTYFNFYERR